MKIRSMFSALALILASSAAFATTETGTVALTATGCTTAPVFNVAYEKDDDSGWTKLTFPQMLCVSNSGDFSLSGLPSNLLPVQRYTVPAIAMSNGNVVPATVVMLSGTSYIPINAWNGTTISAFGFAASGSKGVPQGGIVIAYRSPPAP